MRRVGLPAVERDVSLNVGVVEVTSPDLAAFVVLRLFGHPPSKGEGN